jgi:acetyl esterase/lipase
MCAAQVYAGDLPINHPLISPLSAPDSLVARLPRLMLFVGGAEQLVGGNLAFAQRASSLGVSLLSLYTMTCTARSAVLQNHYK